MEFTFNDEELSIIHTGLESISGDDELDDDYTPIEVSSLIKSYRRTLKKIERLIKKEPETPIKSVAELECLAKAVEHQLEFLNETLDIEDVDDIFDVEDMNEEIILCTSTLEKIKGYLNSIHWYKTK